MRRGGVEAVFDELLDDGGGTLDYLAGGYAVYCLGGEGADWCHGCWEEAKSSAAGSTAAGGPERNAKCTRNAVDEAEIWREAQQVFEDSSSLHHDNLLLLYLKNGDASQPSP